MIVSVHLADVGLRAVPSILRKPPDPDAVPGLTYAETVTTAPLGKRLLPTPQFGRVGLIAAWEEDGALDDFSRLAQKRARTALVSGGLEPVEDAGGGKHSVFAKAFLDALAANTGIVDMSQIFSSMRRQVILSAQQTPQYSDIRQVGHEGGDFIFVRRK